MANWQKILVVLPTVAINHRRNLEGFLRYAHENFVPPWQFHLELGDLAQQGLKNIGEWGCTGIVAVVNNAEERRRYLETGLPTVLIDPTITSPRAAEDAANVVTFYNDHEAEGVTAAEYFLDRHYEHFAYVGTPSPVPWSEARRRGFVGRLSKAGRGVAVYPRVPVDMRDDFSAASVRLARWLGRLQRPSAVFVVHDRRAQQVVATAVNAGIRIPQDLAVLGVDDDRLICEHTTPALSSIPVHPEELGKRYAKTLNALLAGERPAPFVRTCHTEVVTRQSTDANAISDPFVSRAVRLATRNLGAHLTADDLAKAAGCSRRTLQTKVMQALGCTFGDALARFRLSAAMSRLESTDLPVGEIARECGFCSPSHLGARLLEATGDTPLSYRAARRGLAPNDGAAVGNRQNNKTKSKGAAK